MNRKLVALFLLLVLSGAAMATASETQPSAQPTQGPPEDPLFPQDISAWTYTPEFAERFKRIKLKESGPVGAYAVNFQVQQIEELDRCVFNIFLDNTLSIDYPEGPVGFLSFTYPMSWAFLKLSPTDRQAVDAAYHAEYREPRAFLAHGGDEEPLTYFQNRANLYQGVAVVTLTFRCDQVVHWNGPLRLWLRTTSNSFHEVGLPDHFLNWMQATLLKWRRSEAKLDPEDLPDRNVWSYTSEFGVRFGLPPLNEPSPTGAQAIAWRVEQYNREEQSCFLDVYLDETIPLVWPEAEYGFSGSRPQLGYFLGLKDRADVIGWFEPYAAYRNAEWFVVRKIPEKEQPMVPRKEHIGGNLFRVIGGGFRFEQHRKHAFPGLSYIAIPVGCMAPPTGKPGPVGLALMKTDGAKHEVILPSPFLERVLQRWRVQVELPLKCKTPKLYPHEHCENRQN
ncbi:MAG: hypothetical protein EPO61_13345 [Nitrospirae bacterium]|nr:MAG: hypothetical protein EPO61_13345 [Nitrospirota bacterium]